MMRVTRIDVTAETSSVAAIVRDGQQVKAWFYQPGGDDRPAKDEYVRRAAIDDETALRGLAAWLQRGLEFTNGAPGRVEAYLVVIGALLDEG